jgi:hypothetical protein
LATLPALFVPSLAANLSPEQWPAERLRLCPSSFQRQVVPQVPEQQRLQLSRPSLFEAEAVAGAGVAPTASGISESPSEIAACHPAAA